MIGQTVNTSLQEQKISKLWNTTHNLKLRFEE